MWTPCRIFRYISTSEALRLEDFTGEHLHLCMILYPLSSEIRTGKVPCSLRPAVHGAAINNLPQFDEVDISHAALGERYVLMLFDDHSNYCWLFAFPETSAENADCAIIYFYAAFGVPKGLMSDGPTHFKNYTLFLVSRGLLTPHHFTLPCIPWSNGAVERLGRSFFVYFVPSYRNYVLIMDNGQIFFLPCKVQ